MLFSIVFDRYMSFKSSEHVTDNTWRSKGLTTCRIRQSHEDIILRVIGCDPTDFLIMSFYYLTRGFPVCY